MQCKKCGTTFRDGSKFCPKCGLPTSNYKRTNQKSAVNKVKSTKIWLIIAIAATGAVVAIAIAAILMIFNFNGNGSPEKIVEQYWKSLGNANVDQMLDCVPNDYLTEIMDEYDLSKSDLKDALEDYFEDWQSYDENDKTFGIDDIDNIEVKVRNMESYSKSELKDYKEKIDDYYDYKRGGFDSNNIEIAEYVQINVVFYDEDGDRLKKYRNYENTAFNYDGKWYCNSALGLIKEAAENY